jgi:DNA polymerase-4
MAVERACLYVDADRFFFSVEALERPGLADDPRPVVISADPRVAPRAVVTTANDAARRLGITSALSAAIVQQNSIDEAALRWEHHGFDRAPAVRLRRRVLDELGLSVSLGLAASPLVAKMASEAAKSAPDHVHVVPPGEEAAFLAPMAVRALIGVGPKAEARLRALGIETIGVLAERPLADLVEAFGQSYGRYLHRASRGEDDSELTDAREWKSISAENTFGADTRDRAALWRELRSQAQEVARRLRGERLLAGEVAIKLRYANWETITRQMRLGAPTDDAELIAATAAALMRRHWDKARAVRLLGVRAGRLQPAGDAVQRSLLEL